MLEYLFVIQTYVSNELKTQSFTLELPTINYGEKLNTLVKDYFYDKFNSLCVDIYNGEEFRKYTVMVSMSEFLCIEPYLTLAKINYTNFIKFIEEDIKELIVEREDT